MVERVEGVAQLEDMLSEPSEAAVEALARLDGDVMVLGASGKMGPTLARMARRAFDRAGLRRRVDGVARFQEAHQEDGLRAQGIETVRCDLLDQAQLERLPDVPNVLHLAVMKFGSTGQEARTWAVNAFLPGLVARNFSRARIVYFSTGNVYGLTPVTAGGSLEEGPLQPVGEYAQSCVGRERIFEHFSRTQGTAVACLRLNYAVETRYGVLHDLAVRVREGRPISLGMGHFNAVWQADANAAALCALAHASSPPLVVNIAGPELLSVRRVAEQLGRLLGRPVTFEGEEGPDALLSNGQLGHRLFGYPRVPVGQVVHWVADWVARGGASFGKPTHFESRDGRF